MNEKIKGTEQWAAHNQSELKLHRRCNDVELRRVQASFNHAIEVLRELNQKNGIQLSAVEIIPDPLPNSVGCHLSMKAFIYAPPEIEPEKQPE